MQPNIDDAMRRARSYWFEDGLNEIAFGSVFILIGLLNWLQEQLPQGAARAGIASLGLPLVLIGGWLVASWLVRLAKERITYPRSGYVGYHQPPRRLRPAAALLGALVSATLVFLLARYPISYNWIPAFQGVFIGGFLFYLGYRVNVMRFVVLALVSAAVGVWAMIASPNEIVGMAAYFGATGLAAVASGGFALNAYLRNNQPTEAA